LMEILALLLLNDVFVASQSVSVVEVA
jgi:hypothetical protein